MIWRKLIQSIAFFKVYTYRFSFKTVNPIVIATGKKIQIKVKIQNTATS